MSPDRLPEVGPRTTVLPPRVRLGHHGEGSLAAVMAAVVERGVLRRPALAGSLRCEVEFVIDEPYPSIRVVFAAGQVLVEDGPSTEPSLRVIGALPDLVSLMTAPAGIGGIPNVMRPRGRAALGKVAFGHVRIEGRLGELRRLLALLRF